MFVADGGGVTVSIGEAEPRLESSDALLASGVHETVQGPGLWQVTDVCGDALALLHQASAVLLRVSPRGV